MRRSKLSRGVCIVGAGMTKFGVVKDKTCRDLLVNAFQEMSSSVEKGLDINDIDAIYLGNYSSEVFEGQGHLAPILADWLGLTPKPATRVENACASAGTALRQGIIAIASGLCDVVLVSGVERMNTLPAEQITDVIASASDALYEIPAGFTFPGIYAALATAHMARYETSIEHLQTAAIKNHNNAALNPKAHFNSSIRDIMATRIQRIKQRGGAIPQWRDEFDFLNDSSANPTIAWPLRLYDCSPVSDGAACVLLAAEKIAKNFTDNPVRLIGSGQASGPALHDATELTSLSSARAASAEAYQMAGIKPRDIQIAEVHDCFTIAEIVATEDLGFFAPGKGALALAEGVTDRDGEKPVNTSGGLKAKGHPVGASGVAQALEIYTQLLGKAGARQVPNRNLELGLTHNVGGTGGTCVVHIYQRV